MKMPKTLGACVDQLYRLREERLELSKAVDKLHVQEEQMKQHILQTFAKGDIEGAKGKVASATLTQRVVAQVTDWDKVWTYVREHNAFHLLQRRVSDVAYREMLDHNQELPGAEPFVVINLSLTKR